MKAYKFELDNSKFNQLKFYPFSIDYMRLVIEPNIKSNQNNLVNCKEELDITATRDIKEIELDVAELKIFKVYMKSIVKSKNKDSSFKNNSKELEFNDDYYHIDKLKIQLGEIKKGEQITIIIEYSAGYYNSHFSIPRSGFHFIINKQQAWTQGETIESRYWFPCIDDPQIKFPREIHVIVPKDLVVISNGEKEVNSTSIKSKNGEEKKLCIWKHNENDPTYVTAVAIGDFVTHQVTYESKITNRSIPLLYYWPNDAVEKRYEYDPLLTFSHTTSIMEFIEDYTQFGYPYKNYKQVAVDDFDFGGMENTTCTIITKDVFHDNKTNDHTDDRDLVCHELAHHWFGDSITCKSWSHTWLNEGFVSYFESLYLSYHNSNSYNDDKSKDSSYTLRESEFYNSIINRTLSRYFNEFKNRYQREIVTDIYKHPDDMFDMHSYRKGAFFLHMLRSKIGDRNFRKCINAYLLHYHGKAAETDDFRKKCEEVVGEDLKAFFNQWVYRAGHPILDIKFSFKDFQQIVSELNITVEQIKNENLEQDKKLEPFIFPVEIKIYYMDSDNQEQEIIKTLDIDKIKNNYSIDLKDKKIKKILFISIDSELKILKQIKDIALINETNTFNLLNMLLEQLLHGKTIVERLDANTFIQKYAINYIKDKSIIELICNTLKNSILSDPFYGVSASSAVTLGSLYNEKNEEINQICYDTLNYFFSKNYIKKDFFDLDPRIRKDLVNAIGKFKKESSIKPLKKIFEIENSPFVKYEIIVAIAKSVTKSDLKVKQEYIKELENYAKLPSFRYHNTRGAIAGLVEIAKSIPNDREILEKISNYIVEKSKPNNPYDVRVNIITFLGELIRFENGEINEHVFCQLIMLLNEPRFRIQQNACNALVNKQAKPFLMLDKEDKNRKIFLPDNYVKGSIKQLTSVAQNDLDGWVRRSAEESLNKIKDWFIEWVDTKLDLKIDLRKSY
jgi:aminopeptidase N